MKSRILLLLVCFTLNGCIALFNPYITVKDEFKNTKKSTFELAANPTEFLSPVTNADITFEHITKVSGEDANVYFVMSRSSSSFKPDKMFCKGRWSNLRTGNA
jgi:PBP1b-binding outer membrane lipoprotein LpoB